MSYTFTVSTLGKAASKESSRYTMSRIGVAPGKKRALCFVTDGRQLTCQWRPADGTPPKRRDSSRGHFSVEPLPARKGEQTITMTGPCSGTVVRGYEQLADAVDDGTEYVPPPVEMVIRDALAHEYVDAVRIDPKLLKTAMEALDTDNVTVLVPKGGKKPLVLMTNEGDFTLLMPRAEPMSEKAVKEGVQAALDQLAAAVGQSGAVEDEADPEVSAGAEREESESCEASETDSEPVEAEPVSEPVAATRSKRPVASPRTKRENIRKAENDAAMNDILDQFGIAA